MRIGVDARELGGQPTGVGRYLGGLIRQWASDRTAQRHEFVLYAPEPHTLKVASDEPLDTRRFVMRQIPGPGGTLWEQARLPRVAAGDHLDVFFSPAYSAPLRLAVPSVVAMHDLSFFAHPEWFRTREGIRRRTIARQAAKRAAAIVTISEFSRGEIVERLAVAPDNVHVIRPGIDGRKRVREGFENGKTAPAQVFRVLYVGSVFNRRHVPDLVRGTAALARRRPGIALDLVGDNRSYPYEDLDAVIAHQSAREFVHWHRYVADDELSALYGRARAFAFLSEYEGLGLTPLEAMTAGIPSLLLDRPVARESCGEAALYIPDTHWRTVANGLEQVLFDEAVRTRLLAAAPAVIARYDWKRAAEETMKVLEDAVRPIDHGGH